MDSLRIDYPVYTQNSTLLLAAGIYLSPERMEELICSNKAAPCKTFSFLRYGSIKENLLHFLSEPPYSTIFARYEKIVYLLQLMENIHLAVPFLESLDYFKRYDPYTYRHILMVFAVSTLLASDLVSDHKDRIRDSSTGPTHDFGKICVPLNILKKPTPLTFSERAILEHHTIAGYALLSYYLKDQRSIAAMVSRDHHERRNGSGYPRGIALADNTVEIIAACDVYDALISKRPYRPVSYDNRAALEEITGMAERGEIGWNVVRALISHNRKTKTHFSETRLSEEKRGMPPPGNVHGITAEEEEGKEK